MLNWCYSFSVGPWVPWVHICTSGGFYGGGNDLSYAEGETEVKFIRNTREIHKIGKNSKNSN